MSIFDPVASELFSQSMNLRASLAVPYRPLPSNQAMAELTEVIRKTLFPGFYGESSAHPDALRYKVDAGIRDVSKKLQEMIRLAVCYDCGEMDEKECAACQDRAPALASAFIHALPSLRRKLEADLAAIYNGDPAANSMVEVICCYPGFRAITNYRIAHELLNLGIPLLPRMITELAHAQTGIDIHPAATIGQGLMIDHGTGIVIGATAIIGDKVRIYQGVTLGARSFPVDAGGVPVKGIPRHPIVEDEVIIYAEATILGRVTIGKGSVIGGNVWLTRDVPPYSKIQQHKAISHHFGPAEGI